MRCSRGWFQAPLVLRLCLRQVVDASMPSCELEGSQFRNVGTLKLRQAAQSK